MNPTLYTIRVVKNSAQLADALSNDNGVDYVYLDADIELEAGISINANKKTLIIDGRYPDDETGVIHTFTDMNSFSFDDTISISATIALSIKNVRLVGRNYFGIPYVPDVMWLNNVSVTYDNVTYSGPQMTYNPYGLNRYIDCDITIEYSAEPSRAQEVGEVNRVEIGGKTVIKHKNERNAVFWFHGNPTTAYFRILPDADVSIETNSYFMYSLWAIPETSVPVAYWIMSGASFSLQSRTGISLSERHLAASFMVDNDASFIYTQTSPNKTAASLYLNGGLIVNPEADVYMRADYDGGAPLIRFMTDAGKITVADPKSFVLYNKSSAALSFNAQIPVDLSGGQLNYWESAKDFPVAGTFEDAPFRKWHKDSYAYMHMQGNVSGSVTNITYTNLTPEEIGKMPDLKNLKLQTARVFSIGNVALEVNPIVDDQTPITGISDSYAKIKATYFVDGKKTEKGNTAGDDGAFTIETDAPIIKDDVVEMAANTPFLIIDKPYTVVDAGELSIVYAPEDIYFNIKPIAVNPVILPRNIPDDPVTVSDTRVYSTGWKLLAAITGPMKTESDHILRDAVVFTDAEGRYWTMSTTPMTVYTGVPNGGATKVTSITWDNNRGILLRVTDPIYNKEQYTTRLDWTVETI